VKKLLTLILVILFAAPVYADVASDLIACGVNNVTAACVADAFALSYGTVAADGSTYADATAITKAYTYVTASDDAKGVSLPTPTAGKVYLVYNTVASKNLIVYPVAGGTINAGSANAGITIYGKKAAICLATSTTAFLCTAGQVPGTRTLFVPAGNGRRGATATVGWVNTSTNINEATLAQSATADTFTIPISGLNIGDTIVSYKVIGQIESAGGAVTVDADLRMLTNAAADPADSSLGSITQVAKTADYKIADSKTLTTAELIDSGDMPYLLVTATTAGTTDIRLLGVEVVVNRSN
jgi:hypothetical protein